MARSGYSERVRIQVLRAGVQGYMKMVKDERLGKRRVNCPRDVVHDKRRLEWKLEAPSNWFKARDQERNGDMNDMTVANEVTYVMAQRKGWRPRKGTGSSGQGRADSADRRVAADMKERTLKL